MTCPEGRIVEVETFSDGGYGAKRSKVNISDL